MNHQPMPNLDVADLTFEQLQHLRHQLDVEASKKEKAAKAEAISQIAHLAQVFHLTHDDLKGIVDRAKARAKSRGQGTTKAPIKYRHPETGAEWSGRGMPPVWIRDTPKEDWDALYGMVHPTPPSAPTPVLVDEEPPETYVPEEDEGVDEPAAQSMFVNA